MASVRAYTRLLLKLARKLEEGQEIGQMEALRSILVKTVEARMPELLDLAREQVVLIDSAEVLSELTLKMITATTSKSAQRYLLNWHKPTRKKKS